LELFRGTLVVSLAQQIEEFMKLTAEILVRDCGCKGACVRASRQRRDRCRVVVGAHTLRAAYEAAHKVGLPDWVFPEYFECSCDCLSNFPEFLTEVLRENCLGASERSAIEALLLREQAGHPC
jgi:hypothetical protein